MSDHTDVKISKGQGLGGFHPIGYTINTPDAKTLTHEIGHWLDYGLTKKKDGSWLPFSYNTKEELKDFTYKNADKLPLGVLNKLRQVQQLVSKDGVPLFNEQRKWNEVSDIYDALTKGDLYSRGLAPFGHGRNYYTKVSNQTRPEANPLVKHLQIVPENQRNILATDIDLLNPNTTTTIRLGFDEILKGMAQFEQVPYKNTGYTVADILQLYNIIVNSNQYGSERLTTAFKACSNPNNILNKFRKFIADQDYAFDVLQDYELLDYYINAAPIVSTGAERFRTEKFIKVNDPVEGFILKQYDESTNSYKEYNMIPAKDGNESREHRLRRLQNFAEYCPFEMPGMAKAIEMFTAIDYEGDLTEDILNRIKNIIIDFSSSGKLKAFKDC